MKGKIDEKGNLLIERAGKMKALGCPFGGGAEFCGDWCPHFREPDKDFRGDLPYSAIVAICQKKYLNFTDFKDLRGKGE